MDAGKNKNEYDIMESLKNTLDKEKDEQLKDIIVGSIYAEAEKITGDVVTKNSGKKVDLDKNWTIF